MKSQLQKDSSLPNQSLKSTSSRNKVTRKPLDLQLISSSKPSSINVPNSKSKIAQSNQIYSAINTNRLSPYLKNVVINDEQFCSPQQNIQPELNSTPSNPYKEDQLQYGQGQFAQEKIQNENQNQDIKPTSPQLQQWTETLQVMTKRIECLARENQQYSEKILRYESQKDSKLPTYIASSIQSLSCRSQSNNSKNWFESVSKSKKSDSPIINIQKRLIQKSSSSDTTTSNESSDSEKETQIGEKNQLNTQKQIPSKYQIKNQAQNEIINLGAALIKEVNLSKKLQNLFQQNIGSTEHFRRMILEQRFSDLLSGILQVLLQMIQLFNHSIEREFSQSPLISTARKLSSRDVMLSPYTQSIQDINCLSYRQPQLNDKYPTKIDSQFEKIQNSTENKINQIYIPNEWAAFDQNRPQPSQSSHIISQQPKQNHNQSHTSREELIHFRQEPSNNTFSNQFLNLAQQNSSSQLFSGNATPIRQVVHGKLGRTISQQFNHFESFKSPSQLEPASSPQVKSGILSQAYSPYFYNEKSVQNRFPQTTHMNYQNSKHQSVHPKDLIDPKNLNLEDGFEMDQINNRTQLQSFGQFQNFNHNIQLVNNKNQQFNVDQKEYYQNQNSQYFQERNSKQRNKYENGNQNTSDSSSFSSFQSVEIELNQKTTEINKNQKTNKIEKEKEKINVNRSFEQFSYEKQDSSMIESLKVQDSCVQFNQSQSIPNLNIQYKNKSKSSHIETKQKVSLMPCMRVKSNANRGQQPQKGPLDQSSIFNESKNKLNFTLSERIEKENPYVNKPLPVSIEFVGAKAKVRADTQLNRQFNIINGEAKNASLKKENQIDQSSSEIPFNSKMINQNISIQQKLN